MGNVRVSQLIEYGKGRRCDATWLRTRDCVLRSTVDNRVSWSGLATGDLYRRSDVRYQECMQ